MKITVEHWEEQENEVVLRCRELDEEMLWVLSLLRSGLQRLCVWDGEREATLLSPREVVYCESVDERTFVYTSGAVFQTALSLGSWRTGTAGWGCFGRGSRRWSTSTTSGP